MTNPLQEKFESRMSKSETNPNNEFSKKEFEHDAVPDWYKKLLDERRKAVETGQEKILDWDQVKDSIGKQRAP